MQEFHALPRVAIATYLNGKNDLETASAVELRQPSKLPKGYSLIFTAIATSFMLSWHI